MQNTTGLTMRLDLLDFIGGSGALRMTLSWISRLYQMGNVVHKRF